MDKGVMILDRFELLKEMLKKQGIASQNEIIPKKENGYLEKKLSYEQKRIWFIQQFDPQSPAYNDPIAIAIKGNLNVQALEEALNYVVRRHETLRSTFDTIKGEPVLMIQPELKVQLEIEKLPELERSYKKEEVQSIIVNFTKEILDLKMGPLIKIKLIQKAKDDYVLAINLHHIISDGWSKGILAQELIKYYYAYSRNIQPSAEKLDFQYSDYVKWQHDFMLSPEYQDDLDFWKKNLKDAPPFLELPLNFPRPKIQTSNGTYLPFEINNVLAGKLRGLAKEKKVTLFMLLLTAFNILLYRYTQKDDIIIGSPIAGRRLKEVENLIGLFINTIVLRTDLSGEPDFEMLLERVKKQAQEVYSHQSLPFEKLVEEINPQRDMSYSPIFQVLFTYQNTPLQKLQIEGLDIEILSFDSGFSQFDLSLTVWEADEGLKCQLEYNTDLFLPSTIARMARHFQILLENIILHPKARISDIMFLSEEEKQMIFFDFNRTDRALPLGESVVSLFENIVRMYPENIAAISQNQEITYRALNSRANQVANYLLKSGVKKEQVIAIHFPNSIELLIAILGILKAGACYIPLDPDYPANRIQSILEDASVSFIITSKEYQDKLNGIGEMIFLLLNSDSDRLDQESSANPDIKISSQDAICVIYTSGSTGKPKGVLLEHGNIHNLIYSFIYTYQPHPVDRMLPLTGVASASLVGEILPVICFGGTVILSESVYLLDYDHLVSLMDRHKVTILSTVPSMLARLNNEKTDLSSLRYILSGGEALAESDINHLMNKIKIVNGYGITETTICSTCYLLNDFHEGKFFDIVGKPIINTRIYILDQNKNPMPIGCPGEIYIAGTGVARGYLCDETKTKEHFFSVKIAGREERIFRSGDSGAWTEDGQVRFLGRIDKQVKIRGFRIEPGEIENALSSHPYIQDAFVTVSQNLNQGKNLIAYVVLKESGKDIIPQLKDYLLRFLPDYMIPSFFVSMHELPLTGNGKIDLEKLPEPVGIRPELVEKYVAPQTDVETKITEVWKELLKIEKIGVNDNFFDLGGHSLLMMQVHSRLKELFQKDISIVDLFRFPTIRTISKFLSGTDEDEEKNIKEIYERAKMRQKAAQNHYQNLLKR